MQLKKQLENVSMSMLDVNWIQGSHCMEQN
jgi:hypothetical protein